MTACVCGHAAFLHRPGCLRWWLGCGCTEFLPDDGTEPCMGSAVKDTSPNRYALNGRFAQNV